MANIFNIRTIERFMGSLLPFPDNSAKSILELNPKFDIFHKAGFNVKEAVIPQSIYYQDLTKSGEQNRPHAEFGSISYYHNQIYSKIDTDKFSRIQDYRAMATFTELADALDEIADEVIVKDENNVIIQCDVKRTQDHKVTEEEEKNDNALKKEFQKFIEIFDLENKGWEYFRQFLVEGELFFENIILEDKKELGIIGVVLLPAELVTPNYLNVYNNAIDNFTLRKLDIIQQEQTNAANRPGRYVQGAVHYNDPSPLSEQLIILDTNQVTYVHSGLWDETKSFRVPYIEEARKPLKQLNLIEDSIVIYRLVRAPERLVFKINVGDMPAPKAEAHMRRLMQQYWTKKIWDPQKGSIINGYDPQSMLDSYWFPVDSQGRGADVTTLQTSAALGEIKELEYFKEKLLKSLKIPTNRFAADTPFSDGAEITRAELRFARFIIRLQRQFAQALKRTFITHLKLKGKWKEWGLKESMLHLEFNTPTTYMILKQQQILDIKFKNFNELSNNESFSKTFAMKHYLDYSDEQIEENRKLLKEDALKKFEIDKIATYGPNWKKLTIAEHTKILAEGEQATISAAVAGDLGGGGGNLTGGYDLIDVAGPPESNMAGIPGAPSVESPTEEPIDTEVTTTEETPQEG